MTNRLSPQPATPPVPKFDAQTARRFLAHILDTEVGVCEIRIKGATYDRGGYIVRGERYSSVFAGWFDNINDMIVDLGRVRGVSAYVTINPVIPALMARSPNKIIKRTKDDPSTTKDEDVVAYRRLFIDIDPDTPDGISATDEEVAAVVAVRDRILFEHPALADSAIWGRSGNGAFILVLLPDYPIEEGYGLAGRALAWLAARYNAGGIEIDVKTKNAARIGPIPGTAKCKGAHMPDRPHRLATLDCDRDPADIPPCDLEAWLESVGADRVGIEAAQQGRRKAESNGNGHANGHANGHRDPRTPRDGADRIFRASAYIETMKPAISGQRGHDQTFDAACSLIHGFGLSIGEARPILESYNLRCQPPWAPHELEHKLQEADGHIDPRGRPRGHLLDEGNGPRRAAGGRDPAPNAAPGDGDPASARVDIVPAEIVVNTHVCGLLRNHDGLYQRNYRLVEIARLPSEEGRRRIGTIPAGTPMQVNIEGPRLREIVSGVATFFAGGKPAHPPDWCVSAILHRRYWPGVPLLTSVVEHPVLRPDGSMMGGSGYDEETGILCISDDEFLPVPERPTQGDAREAAGRLLQLVADFPFQGAPHRAAWLACLLTILNRHLIDDAVPLFLIEATVSGTGKTLLCDLISRIATGRDMVRGAYYHDAIEMDKRIVSAALEGIRVTMLDNVEGSFGNSSLDNALTGRWYQGRVLGQSSMTAPLLLDSVFVATGNNINFVGDVFRRIVLCRLESPHERPDRDNTRHRIADIRQYALDHRAELIRDAMVIMRAYLQVGCPHELPMNVYGAWTRIIRGAVAWATGIDPMENDVDLAEADVARMSRAGLIEGFVEMLRYLGAYGMTGGQILDALQEDMHADRFETIRDAIGNLWPNGKLPGSGSLGRKMMSMRGARAGHFRLIKIDMHKHTAVWGVQYWDSDAEQWATVTDWEAIGYLFEGPDRGENGTSDQVYRSRFSSPRFADSVDSDGDPAF